MTEIKVPLFKVFMPPTAAEAVKSTLFSGYIASGGKAAQLTELVSEFIGNPYTVLVNSCTSALTIAYRLAGVGYGDEVITTPLTSIASNVPILSLGAKPIWADCDRQTGMPLPQSIEEMINKKTKAILVLHKDGDLASLNEILVIAKKYGVKVIEDAAHAFGARYKGVRIGNHGDFVCFSFQAIKHITTGDGGALLCKNEADYWRARKLKWFGVDKEASRGKDNPFAHDVDEWGYKADLNDIAATIGIEQMKYVNEIIAKYNTNGLLYSKLLQGVSGVELLKRESVDFSIFWTYCLLAENRNALINKLHENGIGADYYHPRNDKWTIFSESKRELPGVDYFSERELSLPCGWWVSQEEIENVISIIKGGW